jgi:hypothetical protein
MKREPSVPAEKRNLESGERMSLVTSPACAVNWSTRGEPGTKSKGYVKIYMFPLSVPPINPIVIFYLLPAEPAVTHLTYLI